jgi:hypothetical protein
MPRPASERWTNDFPKSVGYYWRRSKGDDDSSATIIIEVSGGAPGVEQVVFLGDEEMSKRKFQREYPRSQYYGPLKPPGSL